MAISKPFGTTSKDELDYLRYGYYAHDHYNEAQRYREAQIRAQTEAMRRQLDSHTFQNPSPPPPVAIAPRKSKVLLLL